MFADETNILKRLRGSVVNTILIITILVLLPVFVEVLVARDFVVEQIQVNPNVVVGGIFFLLVTSISLFFVFRQSKSLSVAIPIPFMFYGAGALFLLNDPFGPSLVSYWMISTLVVIFVAIVYGRLAMVVTLSLIIVSTGIIAYNQGSINGVITYVSFSPIIILIALFIDSSMVRLVEALEHLSSTKVKLEESLGTINRQRQQEQLITQRLDLVVSNISEAVVLVDKNYEIQLINLLGTRYLDKKRGDRFNTSVFLDDRTNATVDILESLFAKGSGNQFSDHLELNFKNGKMPVEVIVTPVWIDGVIEFGLIIIRDVTETREVDKLKSEFVSVASHQMRTPLTAIKWNLENLNDMKDLEGAEAREILKTVQDSTYRMIELVNDLLSASRIDRGAQVDLVESEFNIVELVQKVIDEYRDKIENSNIEVEFSHPQGEIMYLGDKEKIFEAISNLVSNAIKYSRENSQVTIKLAKPGNEILLEVSDRGIGIPAEDQPNIFKKFFRAGNARKKLAEGNGIGLYVVKNFIEAHNGQVKFVSNPEKATTFYVNLPERHSEK